jgi:phenylpropionate dioxygenase-like ring-hydroxylating dioxygenase large terminal subunit
MNQQIIQRSDSWDNVAIAGLVGNGRVHSRAYTDPEIFELELTRIFARSWIYIGHESEVPEAGDYETRIMGRTPVIMVRGKDDVVRVLVNRCRHRGAQLCESESGNTGLFKCWYHGWVYDTTGKLIEISGEEAYGAKKDTSTLGLSAVPRVESYRGFVFASLSSAGETLATFLGNAAPVIDLLIDASPTGELLVDGGSHKTEYRGNWKLVGMDGYHPLYLHASVLETMRRKPDSGLGSTHRSNPFTDEAATYTRDFGHGHSMLDFREHRIQQYSQHAEFLKNIIGGQDYIDAMIEAYGEQRATMLLSIGGDPHLGLFPNMQLIHNQIRIITPLAVDLTQVTMIAVRLGGVSDELNAERLRQHESFYGPAGAGSPDDTEIFERVQCGMAAEVNPWLDVSRGMNREQIDEDGTIVGNIGDEVPQRGIFRHWVSLMTQAD